MLSQISLCEYCKQQIPCRNLYVALKILEEELRCAQRPHLNQRFQRLKNDMSAACYTYPNTGRFCSLKNKSEGIFSYLTRSESLLTETRHTLRVGNL